MFRLAERLGMLVEELAVRMSSREFTEWMVVERLSSAEAEARHAHDKSKGG